MLDLTVPKSSASAEPPPPPSAAPRATSPEGSPGATTTSADDRATSFRPVEGGGEMQSGEKLLVEAYAAIWLILFGVVLLSWRRQRGLDERVERLASALAKHRAEASSASAIGATSSPPATET